MLEHLLPLRLGESIRRGRAGEFSACVPDGTLVASLYCRVCAYYFLVTAFMVEIVRGAGWQVNGWGGKRRRVRLLMQAERLYQR
jgi:hypothetical protein